MFGISVSDFEAESLDNYCDYSRVFKLLRGRGIPGVTDSCVPPAQADQESVPANRLYSLPVTEK